jgi:hypothetical protein
MRLAFLNAAESGLLAAFAEARVAFAVVGGHAVLCYSPVERPDGSLRTLGDLDVLVATTEHNLGRLSAALASLHVALSPAQLREAYDTKKLPNLLMYRTQLFPEIAGVQTAEVLLHCESAGSSVGPLPVISRSLLVAAKVAAGRPKDLDDVRAIQASEAKDCVA